ncbi:Ribonucleases P/MRP protein subunit pop1, partial [Linderina pennispora]
MAGPGNSKSSGKRKYQHATAQQQQAQATANFSLAKARSVDVTGFVESRSFEINALQRSLDNSSNNGMARAFQTLPRHLRRRAASHNVKRIPKRLRDKAISEMKKSAMSSKKLDGTGKLTNAKSGNRYKRRRTRSVREEYELRQRGKRWLETHVWHAKRMHMEERWGTMVARTPNERSHRAAYRAAKEKAFVEDVSYFAMLQVVGPQEQIVKALETMMAKGVVTVAMERFLRGSRAAPVTFYRAGKAPLDCLGPALAIWKPQQSGDSSRTLWIRAHPAISASVVEEINKASQLQSCASVSVEDITTDLVAFELLGGQSTPLLASIISPNICDPEGTGGKLVNTIANTPSPASLPEGSVIALRIHDPRLKFPYKLEKTDERPTEHEQKELADLMLHWPKDTNQFSQDSSDAGIWDIAQTRKDLERRVSEHQLNERRRDILVPGTKLTPDPLIDVTVPLLLIRTGPEALLGSPSSTLDSEYVDSLAHGWTVLAPRGWGMPLWLSFIFAGARAQGYQERHHIAFEAGLPIFPLHWPGTRSYDDWVGPIAHDDYLRWSRRPMAKRENYLKHGVKSPFFPPFHQLLGLQGIPAQYPVVSSDDL